MSVTRPTIDQPGWFPADPANSVEPDNAKKLEGWLPGQPLPAQNENWLNESTSTWIEYNTDYLEKVLGTNGFSIDDSNSPYNLTDNEKRVLYVGTTVANVTINLPPAADFAGLSVVIVKLDPLNSIIINAAAGEEIDAASSLTMNFRSLVIRSAGVAWVTVSSGNVSGPATAVNSNIAFFDGTSGKVLKDLSIPVSNIGGRLLSVQYRTSSGTYTKATNNPTYIIVEVIGGGGGGGGCAATGGSTYAVAGGGGGGGYSRRYILASALAASETVTVGAGATAATAGNNNGNNGGTSSFGAFCSATGGVGGRGSSASLTPSENIGGVSGVGSGGDLNVAGQDGGCGSRAADTSIAGGFGGGSFYAGSTLQGSIFGNAPGKDGYFPGGGGSGAFSNTVDAARPGSLGGGGLVIIWEYS
jgi:hypothetical protein